MIGDKYYLWRLLPDADTVKDLMVPTIALIVGFLLNKLLPTLASLGQRLASQLGRLVGGRFAYRAFERRYLDWLSIELRELRLPGIVTAETDKKPHLEQVFVSLRLTYQRETPQDSLIMERLSAKLKKYQRRVFLTPRTKKKIAAAIAETLIDIGVREEGRVREVSEASLGMFRSYGPSLLPSSPLRWARTLIPLFGLLSHRQVADWVVEMMEPANVVKHFLNSSARLAILGGPGSGKTTLLQFVGLIYAKERAGGSGIRERGQLVERLGQKVWKTPILIPLASIAGDLISKGTRKKAAIMELIPTILPPDLQADPVASDYFRKRIESGNAILLFDGLDEVPGDEEFAAAVEAVEGMSLRYRENTYIVTSREAGWRGGVGADFEVVFVEDLDEKQIEHFVTTWYDAVEKNSVPGKLSEETRAEELARRRRAEKRSRELLDALQRNERISYLARSPMLLSIIALVHRTLATLPRERAKLYAECAKVLLEQWDISKGVHLDDTGLKLEQKEAMLRHIAFAFHSGEISGQEGGREGSFAMVVEKVGELLPSLGRKRRDARKLLARLIERSGLLVERRRGVLVFSHLTFQEYFCAQFIAKEGREDLLFQAQRIQRDWWREVALLYAGLIGDSAGFIDKICSIQDPSLVRRIDRLATQALGEAVEVRDPAVRNEVLARASAVRLGGESLGEEVLKSREVMVYLSRWAANEGEWSEAAARVSMRRLRGLAERRELERAEQELVELLSSRNQVDQLAGLTALGELGARSISGEGLKALERLLNSGSFEVRRKLVSLLRCDDPWAKGKMWEILEGRPGSAVHDLVLTRLLESCGEAGEGCRRLFGMWDSWSWVDKVRILLVCSEELPEDRLEESLRWVLSLDSDKSLRRASELPWRTLLLRSIPKGQKLLLDYLENAVRSGSIDKSDAENLHLLEYLEGAEEVISRGVGILKWSVQHDPGTSTPAHSLVRLARRATKMDREGVKALALSEGYGHQGSLLRFLGSVGVELDGNDVERIEELINVGRREVRLGAIRALASRGADESVDERMTGILLNLAEKGRREVMIAALWALGERRAADRLPRERLVTYLNSRNPVLFGVVAVGIYRTPSLKVDRELTQSALKRLWSEGKRGNSTVRIWRSGLAMSRGTWMEVADLKIYGRGSALARYGLMAPSLRPLEAQGLWELSPTGGALLVCAAAARQGAGEQLAEEMAGRRHCLRLNYLEEELMVGVLARLWQRGAMPEGFGLRWENWMEEEALTMHGMPGLSAVYAEGAGFMDATDEEECVPLERAFVLESMRGRKEKVGVSYYYVAELARSALCEKVGEGKELLEFVRQCLGDGALRSRAWLVGRLIKSLQREDEGLDLSSTVASVLEVAGDEEINFLLELAEVEVAAGRGTRRLLKGCEKLLDHSEVSVRQRAWDVFAKGVSQLPVN